MRKNIVESENIFMCLTKQFCGTYAGKKLLLGCPRNNFKNLQFKILYNMAVFLKKFKKFLEEFDTVQ